MADLLRLLAIHVAEPHPGRFEWVITEQVNEDRWKEIDRAEDGSKTYKAAMASGLVALEEMIPDLDMGPQRSPERSDEPRTRPQDTIQTPPSDGTASPKGKPKKAAYFGFGPIR